MATSKNNPPTNASIDATQFKKQLKELLEDQGDYNNLLKNALRDLKQIDNAYDKISARIATMNRDSINVKDVNKELYSLKQKEYLENLKMSKLQEELGQDTVKQYQDIKKQAEEYAKINQAKGKTVDIDKTIMAIATKSGNMEVIALQAQHRFIELAEKKRKEGEIALENEQKIGKQMGITGNLFKLFTDKLGIGEKVYGAMAEKARQLVEKNKEVTGFGGKLQVIGAGFKAIGIQIKESLSDPAFRAAALIGAYKLLEAGLSKVGQGFQKAGSFVKSFSEDSSNVVSGLADPIADLVSNIPLVGGLISGMVKGFASFLDLVVGVEDKIVKMGRQLNLSVGEAMALNRQFSEMSLHSGDVFMNSKKLMESQVELSGQLGINNILSEQTLETNSKLKEFAGLEADTRAKIAESSIITGKSSESVVKSVIAQVSGLKNATGISFNYQKILGEASRMSGVLGLEFAKYPDKLAKSLVITKALGLDLQKLENMAESFLDFESSISNEFEAQLLTGKEINLTKAREAFLNNDLATAATEITRQVGSAKDFLHMNRIAADSMAKAFGMSRDEMANMLKQQELLSKFGAKDTKDLQAKVVALKEQGKEKEAILMLGSQEEYQNMINASTQEKMMGIIEKIKQSLTDFLMNSGIVEKIQGFVNYLSEPKNIKAIISSIQGFLADAIEFISKAAYYVLNALDVVSFGSIDNDLIDSVKSGGESMGASIRSFGGGMAGGSTEVSSTKVSSEEKAAKSAQRAGFAGVSKSGGDTYVALNAKIEPTSGKVTVEAVKSGTKDNNKYSPAGGASQIIAG